MSASPKYKLYAPDNEYVGSMKYAEDAAAMVAILGDGARIKVHHRKVVWEEGLETFSAGESYDRAREIIHERENA